MEKEQTIANKTPLISVIVPVYKVEQFIHRCVDSILNQTYTNLEIILVDDGSPDRCGEICDEYAEKDSRIRVIHQKNGGLSAARNAGLDICTGEYIAFADPDDYLLCNMYEELVDAFREHDVDICVCQWQYENVNGNYVIDPLKIDASVFGKKSAVSFAEYLYRKQYERMVVCVVWNKLYKRYVFDNTRFFGRRSEDEQIHTTILSRNYSVFVIPDLLYVYCQNINSITNKPFDIDSLIFLDVLAERVRSFPNNTFIKDNSNLIYCEMYISLYYEAMKCGVAMRDIQNFDKAVKSLIFSKLVTLKFLIRMLLFRILPKLYYKLFMKKKI